MESFIKFHYNDQPSQQRYILNTFKLFQEKATIPFIARYRRALTNNADANLLGIWFESYEVYEQVQDKKYKMIQELQKRDDKGNKSSSSFNGNASSSTKILTPQLKKSILNAWTTQILDDLWLPFRTTRCTKAEEATKFGLKPLAIKCFKQECDDFYINDAIKKLRLSVERDKAYEMIAHIVATKFNEMSNIRKELRSFVKRQGQFHVSLKKGSPGEKMDRGNSHKRKRGGDSHNHVCKNTNKHGIYDNYHNWKCLFENVKPHQLLAIERGVKEKVLSLTIHFEGGSRSNSHKRNNKKTLTVAERKNKMMRYLVSLIRKHANCSYQNHFKNNKCYAREKIIDAACEDAWKRLLRPSLIREVRKDLRAKAHKDAIKCFARNVKNLLMTKPYYGHTVLSIDPGYRAGCKCAVVNKQGVVLNTTTIWPKFQQRGYNNTNNKKSRLNPSSSSSISRDGNSNHNKSKSILLKLIQKHQVTLIALGNGTASRKVEQWLSANILNCRDAVPKELSYIVVDEAGASVYSTSKEAQSEFGNLDPLAIGSITLARRVQNPLSELVKVPPQSLGVGMYQHDLSPKDLEKHLDQVVSIVVSDVGIDVNNASISLLRRIAGLNRKTATAIFDYVRNVTKLKSRRDILNISGIGPKTYEQAVGFLKIYGGKCYLDETNIHPESYQLTYNICEMYNIQFGGKNSMAQASKILSSKSEIEKIKFKFKVQSEEEIRLILKTLGKPNADPRENKAQQVLRKGPKTVDSLEVHSVLTGTVKNVANFGAFVDIGVGVDGLLHNSKMSNNLKNTISVGDVLHVEILSVELGNRKKISLGSIDL